MTNTQVLVSARGGGKTYRSIEWLIEGEKIDGWPGWSRVLVVPTAQRCRSLTKEHADGELGRKFYEKAGVSLSKVVLNVDEYRTFRGIDKRQFEIAVDGTESLIEQALGWRPSWVTYDGESV